ncbi:MAG: phytanoyl-CoA dioxygenase family protein [candidate division Zixibacteria bacterium]|nr:phytanoyl-CoA dioxygenase family protein [candidate division Zixibacteria bacterium]
MSISITQDQIARWMRDGYLQVSDLLTLEEVRQFMDHEADPETPKLRNGLRTHLTDPVWKYLAHHPNVAGIARQLLDGPPRIVQTMYLAKAAAREGEEKGGIGISLHQDTHYLPNEPNTLMACWIAMNDTDADNGGLCVVPGSHKKGLRHTSLNTDPEHASWETEHTLRTRDGREWKQTIYSYHIDGIENETIVKLAVPAGSGVFFTGMTIHGSYANRSHTRPRFAFPVHYVREDTWVLRTDVQETTQVESAYATS